MFTAKLSLIADAWTLQTFLLSCACLVHFLDLPVLDSSLLALLNNMLQKKKKNHTFFTPGTLHLKTSKAFGLCYANTNPCVLSFPFSVDFSNVPNTMTACPVTVRWGLRRMSARIHPGKSSRPRWKRNSGWLLGTRTRATPSLMLRQLLMHINILLFLKQKQTKDTFFKISSALFLHTLNFLL